MAIKPKSRAHEDRIKALEEASKADALLGHETDERIRALELEVSAQSVRLNAAFAILQRAYERRWWQFWK